MLKVRTGDRSTANLKRDSDSDILIEVDSSKPEGIMGIGHSRVTSWSSRTCLTVEGVYAVSCCPVQQVQMHSCVCLYFQVFRVTGTLLGQQVPTLLLVWALMTHSLKNTLNPSGTLVHNAKNDFSIFRNDFTKFFMYMNSYMNS